MVKHTNVVFSSDLNNGCISGRFDIKDNFGGHWFRRQCRATPVDPCPFRYTRVYSQIAGQALVTVLRHTLPIYGGIRFRNSELRDCHAGFAGVSIRLQNIKPAQGEGAGSPAKCSCSIGGNDSYGISGSLNNCFTFGH